MDQQTTAEIDRLLAFAGQVVKDAKAANLDRNPLKVRAKIDEARRILANVETELDRMPTLF